MSLQAELQTPALTDSDLRMSYRVARGEQGVLTFEPYKSFLLPHWRFKTEAIAKKSAEQLWAYFGAYVQASDFVGADMSRKFIQMGMTRAKRYANHKGGRKYDADGHVKDKTDHEGRSEKEKASHIFREYWLQCRQDGKYQELKIEFLKEQKAWSKRAKIT